MNSTDLSNSERKIYLENLSDPLLHDLQIGSLLHLDFDLLDRGQLKPLVVRDVQLQLCFSFFPESSIIG